MAKKKKRILLFRSQKKRPRQVGFVWPRWLFFSTLAIVVVWWSLTYRKGFSHLLLHFPIGWRRCRIGKVKEKRGHACALRCAHDSAVGFSSWPLKTAAGFALEVPASADAVMCKRKKEKKATEKERNGSMSNDFTLLSHSRLSRAKHKTCTRPFLYAFSTASTSKSRRGLSLSLSLSNYLEFSDKFFFFSHDCLFVFNR